MVSGMLVVQIEELLIDTSGALDCSQSWAQQLPVKIPIRIFKVKDLT